MAMSRLPELIVVPSSIRVVAGTTIPLAVLRVDGSDTTVIRTVTWSVGGGGSVVAGVYTAPSQPGTYKLTASRDGYADGTTTIAVVDPGATGSDAIRLTGIKRSTVPVRDPLPVAVVSGRDGASGECVRHLVLRSDLIVPALDGDGACAQQVVVLAPDRKPVQRAGQSLTSAPDVVDVSLAEPAIAVSVVVWALVGHAVRGGDEFPIKDVVATDFAAANATLAAARTGVTLEWTLKRGWLSEEAVETIGTTCSAGLASTAWHDPDKLNVYYVPAVDANLLLHGLHCADAGVPNAIFVSADYAPELTLAHEVGHAFGLQHTGDAAGPWYEVPEGDRTRSRLGQGNLMWSDLRDAGTSLSLGQAYRTIASDASALQRLGLSPVASQSCECVNCVRGAWSRFIEESDAEGRACPRITRVAR